MTPREENARITMPQSGVRATPHKGLITENKDGACHSRTSERHHIKGLIISKVRNEYTPQSDVCATSHKGLIL